MIDLPGLRAAFKDIASFPGWSPPEETGYTSFAAPLAIGGVVEAGFALHGGCFQQFRDVNVSFELVLGKTATRRRTVLERVEWRSLKGGHSNKRERPLGVPRRTDETHVHPFEFNYLQAHRRMRGGNLPIAEDIEENIETYEDLVLFIGRKFHIRNIDIVTRPNWEYGLF